MARRKSQTTPRMRRYLKFLRALLVYLRPRYTFMLGDFPVHEGVTIFLACKALRRREIPNVVFLYPPYWKGLDALARNPKAQGRFGSWKRDEWDKRVSDAVLKRIHADTIIVGEQVNMAVLDEALIALVPLIDSGTTIIITNVHDPVRRRLHDGLVERGWRAGEVGSLGVLHRA